MRRFLILCGLCVFFITCTKEYYNPIPSLPVYLEVDLTHRDKELRSIPSYKIFTSQNIIVGKERTGYAGVLVTYSTSGDYKAFDVACPNEVRSDAVVEIDDNYNAVCKVCGSKYEVILNGGSGICIGGPSKHALRPYHTTLRDKILIVRN